MSNQCRTNEASCSTSAAPKPFTFKDNTRTVTWLTRKLDILPVVGQSLVDGNQGMSDEVQTLHTAATNLSQAVVVLGKRVEGCMVADPVGSTQELQQLLSLCMVLAKKHKLQKLELSLQLLMNVRVVGTSPQLGSHAKCWLYIYIVESYITQKDTLNHGDKTCGLAVEQVWLVKQEFS